MSSFYIILIKYWLFFNWVSIVLPKESRSNCWNYVLSKIHRILQKLMILFTFAIYIRIILEMNQFILISWVYEVYHFNFNGTKRIVSNIIEILVLILLMVIVFITILLTWSKDAYKLSESWDIRNKFAHLFDGVSLNKKSMLFVWLLQIRRAIFVILLIIIGRSRQLRLSVY